MRKQITRLNANASSGNHNTWVCSLCYPFALEIGRVYHVGSLIYMRNNPKDTLMPKEYTEKGTYALLCGQGHRDDEMAFFEDKPEFDVDGYYKPYVINMDIGFSIDLYNCYIEQGFIKPNMKPYDFRRFFVMQLAKIVNNFEKKYGKIEDYYSAFCGERLKWVEEQRADTKK